MSSFQREARGSRWRGGGGGGAGSCLCCLCNKLARHWSTPKTSPEGHDRDASPCAPRRREFFRRHRKPHCPTGLLILHTYTGLLRRRHELTGQQHRGRARLHHGDSSPGCGRFSLHAQLTPSCLRVALHGMLCGCPAWLALATSGGGGPRNDRPVLCIAPGLPACRSVRLACVAADMCLWCDPKPWCCRQVSAASSV